MPPWTLLTSIFSFLVAIWVEILMANSLRLRACKLSRKKLNVLRAARQRL